MKKTILLLTTLCCLGSATNVQAQRQSGNDKDILVIETLTAGEGERKVVATGYGYSAEEATSQALRSAVEQAVGAVVGGQTVIENDEVIKDEVLSLSHGFVKTHRVLATEGNATDGFEVTVVAIVTERQLMQTLEARGVKVAYNAGGIFAQYNAWDKMKEDELAIVNQFFGPDAIDQRAGLVYDHSLQVGEPSRDGNNYKVPVTLITTPNANYQAEWESFKAILAEVAYEVMPFTHVSKALYLDDSMPDAQKYVNREPNGVDRRGKTKYKNKYLDISDITYRNGHTLARAYNTYGGARGASFDVEFMAESSRWPSTQLTMGKLTREMTTQDYSRLNDKSLRQVSYVLDFFAHTYTPYVFVLVEGATMFTPYKHITFYKFTNPKSLKVLSDYLTWLYGQIHCDIVFDTTDGESVSKLDGDTNSVYRVVSEFSSDTCSNEVDSHMRGYAFVMPAEDSRAHSVTYTYTFSSEKFSTIRNISAEPYKSTDVLREALR